MLVDVVLKETASLAKTLWEQKIDIPYGEMFALSN